MKLKFNWKISMTNCENKSLTSTNYDRNISLLYPKMYTVKQIAKEFIGLKRIVLQ